MADTPTKRLRSSFDSEYGVIEDGSSRFLPPSSDHNINTASNLNVESLFSSQIAESQFSTNGPTVHFQSPSNAQGVLMSNMRYNQMTWGTLKDPEDKTSKWWQFFYEWTNPNGDPKGYEWPRCRGCMKNISISSQRSTGSLRSHANRCQFFKQNPFYVEKLKIANGTDSTITATTITQGPSTKSISMKTLYDHGFNRNEEVMKKAVEFIVLEYLPMDLLQRPSFIRLMKESNPNIPIIGLDFVRHQIQAADVDRIASLKDTLKGVTFALTYDAWTSVHDIGYITVKIHFIDNNGAPQSLPLACTAVSDVDDEDSHCIEIVINLVREVFNTYHLNLHNFVGFTTDTASTMEKVARLLRQDGSLDDGFVIYNLCAAHSFELTAQLAGEASNAALSHEAISKAKSLVGVIRSSSTITLALSEAKDTILDLNEKNIDRLMQEIPTRWWSTWQLIDHLLEMKPALDILLTQGKIKEGQYLTDAQWSILTMIETVLRPFTFFQKLLEGEKYLTVSLLPLCVVQIRKRLEAGCVKEEFTIDIRELCVTLLQDFNQRWGSGVDGTVYNEHQLQGRERSKGLSLAAMWGSVIDPRTMMFLSKIYGPNDENLIIQSAMTEAKRLYTLSSASKTDQLEQLLGAGPQQQDEEDSGGFDLSLLGIVAVPHRQRILSANELDMAVNQEYANLLREDSLPLPTECFHPDPIKWWHDREYKFPILSCLAKRILLTPTISALSERLFTHAGIAITKDRENLLPDLAENHILLHDFYVNKYKDM